MLMRLMDFMKSAGITAVFVSLTAGGETLEKTTSEFPRSPTRGFCCETSS